MNEKPNAERLVVRKVQFEFPEDFRPHWNPGKPELSHAFNSLSFIATHFEPFVIDAYREASTQITDPTLQKEVTSFIAQESQHFRQHRRFNAMLIAKGYEQLREYDQQLATEFAQLKTRPLKFQIAYGAGLETMALGLGHMFVDLRAYLFGNADTHIASLWLWHFMEEIEHKNVAFDVNHHVYGDYWYRVYGMFYGVAHLFRHIRRGYILLLKADGLWGKWQTRWALKKAAFRIWSYMLPRIIRYALPGHHPSQVADPAWMQEWVALYDQGEKGLLTLDTTKIRMTPAGMLPT